MTVKQIQQLESKVESLTPILAKTIRDFDKFENNYIDSERKNNARLQELVSTLSSQKNESMIPPGIVEELVSSRNRVSELEEVIGILIKQRDDLNEELEQATDILKNVDPSALKTALGASGLGVALGLPGMMPGGEPGVDGTGPEAMVTGGTLPTQATVTSGVGMREHPIYGGYKMHKGVDVSAGAGTPVSSAQDATVVHAGFRNDGYGNSVVLRYSDGAETRFGHFQSVNVRTGSTIKAGQLLGREGSTGDSTGSHVHFEHWPNGGAMSFGNNFNRNAQSIMNSYFRYGGGVKPKPQQAAQLKPEEQSRRVASTAQSQTQQTAQQRQSSSSSSGAGTGSVQPNYLAILQLSSSK